MHDILRKKESIELFYWGLVQWLEHEAYTFGVVGSNPTPPTNKPFSRVFIINREINGYMPFSYFIES